MIPLRYHIVSIAAVFLALALGVVLGSTSVSERLLSRVGGGGQASGKEVAELRAERDALRAELGRSERFGAAVAPLAVQDRLDRRNVVLITAAGANEQDRDALRKLIEQSGAKITGELHLTASFTDPNQAGRLRTIVTRLLPAGVQLPAVSDPGTLAGGLIGPLTLLDPRTHQPQASREESAAALSGLTQGGFLSVARPVQPAQLAVVLTGSPGTGDVAGERAATVARFAAQLDRSGAGAVLAGRAAAAEGRGPVGAARADPGTSAILSTVDNVGSPAGRVAVVLALREQLDNRAGQYGVAGGSEGPVPGARS